MSVQGKSFSRNISVYHANRWRAARKHLKCLCRNDDEETIHKLRVEIKKITALYELIGYCDKDFDGKKILRPLSRIFKLLGRLHDHSNALGLCLDFKIDISILDPERRKLKGTIKKILSLAEKHKSDLRKIKRSGVKHLQHTDTDKWEKYLHKKHLNITNSLAGTLTEKQLHETRTAIKKLIYNAGLYSTETIKKPEIARLDRIEKLINQWHDICVFRSKLDEMNFKIAAPKIYGAVKRKEQLMMKEIRLLSLR